MGSRFEVSLGSVLETRVELNRERRIQSILDAMKEEDRERKPSKY